MNRTSNILILILICFMCSSKTCSEDNSMKDAQEENLLVSSRDSIRKAFEVDHPDNDLLRAYEQTAKQKLIDFADYLKIVSDDSLDIKFRNQAAEMVKRLFVSGDVEVNNWNSAYPGNELATLNKLLLECLSSGMPLWIRPEQINILNPLTESNDSTFSGKLLFYPKIVPFDIRKAEYTTAQMITIDIYVIRKAKSFGDETLMIWGVYLGNFN